MSNQEAEVNALSDQKEKQMLDYYYGKLRNENFDEKDIYVFFILIRRFTNELWFTERFTKQNWICEIGDLIAHRERKMGKIFNSLKATSQIDRCHSGTVPGSEGLQAEAFRIMLNFLLEQLGYAKLSENIMEDILLCIFSILQLSKYIETDKESGTTTIRRVIVLILENEICLVTDDTGNNLHVNLGIIDNSYMTTDTIKRVKVIHCNNPITVLRSNGNLLIEYNNEIL